MNTIQQTEGTRLATPPSTPEKGERSERRSLGVGGSEAEPAQRGADGAAGLVTSPKTVRVSDSPVQTPFKFATAEECRTGAERVGGWDWSGREGAVPQLEVFPGLVRLTAPDLARRERRLNREADAPVFVSENPDAEDYGDGRKIGGWSSKSRARMVATMAELDLAPLLLQEGRPAMVTLTYPGDWETVAPNGPKVKAHLQSFFKRFERAWGIPWAGVWKLEFQRRGAPHFHLLMVPPTGRAGEQRQALHLARRALWETDRRGPAPRWKKSPGDGKNFRAWLSETWADIVDHPDPDEFRRHVNAGTGVDYTEGDRARDPKRAAVYFGKHGTFAAKDYQHDVPKLWEESGETVGRFWGYRGLKKVHGAATISFDQMILLGRTLRRYGTRTRVWDRERREHKIRPVLRSSYRWRRRKTWVTPAGVVIVQKWQKRKTTTRARRMTGPMSAGFLLVNDGPAMAAILSRVLESCAQCDHSVPVGMRGPIRQRS